MKILISRLIILLLSLLLLSSCAKRLLDDLPENVLGSGSLTATINGDEFSANGILVTAEFSEENGVATLVIGAAELPIAGVTQAIVLAMVAPDGTGIHSGETYTSTNVLKKAAGEYSIDDDASVDIKAVSENTDVATITISNIDFDAKVVSGTFSFDGADEDEPNTIYEVRSGEFKDVAIK